MRNKRSAKITKSSISKILIIIFMLFGVRITHIIFPFSDNPLVMSMILTLVILICFMLENLSFKACSKRTRFLLGILGIGILISAIKSTAIPKAALLYALNYSCIFLCIPLLHVLKKGKWDFDSFIRCIVNISIIAYLLRFLISYIQHFTGAMIFQGMYAETIAKGDWFRGGFMRLNPPCFGNIFIPLAFYLLVNEKSKRKKSFYWMMIAASVFYTYRVHASRSVLLYQLFEIALLVMLYKRSTVQKIITSLLLFIGVFIAVEAGYLEKVINLFSLSNTEYGYSTYSRLLSLARFGSMYLNNPITGVGFIPAEDMSFMDLNYSSKYILEGGNLSDIGFMYSIVQLGAAAILFYIFFFVFGFKAGNLQRSIKENHNLDILAWGIIISVGVTGINIDLFSNVYLYSAPICLAIIDWIYYDAVMKKGRIHAGRDKVLIRKSYNLQYPDLDNTKMSI